MSYVPLGDMQRRKVCYWPIEIHLTGAGMALRASYFDTIPLCAHASSDYGFRCRDPFRAKRKFGLRRNLPGIGRRALNVTLSGALCVFTGGYAMTEIKEHMKVSHHVVAQCRCEAFRSFVSIYSGKIDTPKRVSVAV